MLNQFIISQLFAFLLVFCRVGSAIMILPGFGEAYVPARMRLFLALMLSLVLTPVLIKTLPESPANTFGLLSLLGAEILAGLFLGGISRFIIAAIHMAGMIIAYQSSLASALTQDVTQAQAQGTSLGNLLGITSLVLLFSLNLHHVMLRGIADSYTLFLPGHIPDLGVFADHAAQSVNSAFRMAMQMAAPHVIVGLIIYLVSGIISKLMPNIQIFFIIMAPQLIISFFILMASISAIMLWYMEYFKTTLGGFLSP